MNYLLLKHGLVVTPNGIKKEDILVGGNKILQIEPNIIRPTADTPLIDASEKYIMPGAIDMNRQFLNITNCPTEAEDILKLNQAQIYNGTTSMLDSIEDIYKKDYLFNIKKALKKGAQNQIDYGFHLSFNSMNDITTDAIDYSYIHEGLSSISINISALYNVSEEVIQNIISGVLNNSLLLICELSAAEESHTNLSHKQPSIDIHFKALKMLVDLGLNYGCTILFLNIAYVEEYNLIQGGIKNKADFYGTLSLPFNIGVNLKKNQPILETLNHKVGITHLSEEAVWQIINGSRFTVSTPPYNLSSSNSNERDLVYNRPDRYYFLRNYLSVLFTIGVTQNKITLEKLSEITSSLPAKLMGMYPQKGVLQPGADADLIVWNPNFDRNLYCSFPTSETNNKRFKLKGRCDFVFLKGRMVYNGELYDSKLVKGSFIFRTALDEVILE